MVLQNCLCLFYPFLRQYDVNRQQILETLTTIYITKLIFLLILVFFIITPMFRIFNSVPGMKQIITPFDKIMMQLLDYGENFLI